MAQYLRNLLILSFLISFLSNYTAQTTTLDDDSASEDHITGACMLVTELCSNQLNDSVSGEQFDSVFEPLTICDPITKVCHGGHTSSVIAKTSVEASRQENASLSKLSTFFDPVTKLGKGPQICSVTAKLTGEVSKVVCDPLTHKCTGPKINTSVSTSGKGTISVDDSVISEAAAMINPMLSVCSRQRAHMPEPSSWFWHCYVNQGVLPEHASASILT